MQWLSRNLRPVLAAIGVFSVIAAFGLRSIESAVGGVRHHARDLAGPFEVDNVFTQAPRDIDVPENATEKSGIIAKRFGLLADPAPEYPMFTYYYNKGTAYTDFMLDTEADLDAKGIHQNKYGFSKFNGGALRRDRDGVWREEPDVDEAGMTRLLSDFDQLNCLDNVEGLARSRFLRIKWRLDRGWLYSGWRQSVPYGPGESLAPTHAMCESLINQAGIIVVLVTRSPSFQIGLMGTNQALPYIHRWSDEIYLSYMKRRNSNSGPASAIKERPPSWILVKDVWGPHDTLAIISRCLLLAGWTQLYMPAWTERITFPIGSSCYYAILGTAHGAGVTYFLAQHKYKFLGGVVGSITVYGDGKSNFGDGAYGSPLPEDFGLELPNLLFWITRYDAPNQNKIGVGLTADPPHKDIRAMAFDNFGHETSMIGPMLSFDHPDPRWMDFPHKLRPIYDNDEFIKPARCLD